MMGVDGQGQIEVRRTNHRRSTKGRGGSGNAVTLPIAVGAWTDEVVDGDERHVGGLDGQQTLPAR